jgi:cytochrome c oxidase subunit 2
MIIAGVLILILAVVTVVGAVTAFQLPEAMTEEGEDMTVLYQVTLAISFIVFFGVTSALIYAIFKFKRKPGDPMPVQVHGSSTLEFTWTVIPIIILVALFIPSLILVIDYKTPPAEADADIVVDVVGHQWWWEFQYPNDNVKIQATPPNYDELVPPVLAVPVGKRVLLRIRSTDVIHSFYAPHMLYKIQSIPGNINHMHFKATKTGTFTGQCYQFCGTRHADMRWTLQVMSESDYQQWLRDARSAQPASGSGGGTR